MLIFAGIDEWTVDSVGCRRVEAANFYLLDADECLWKLLCFGIDVLNMSGTGIVSSSDSLCTSIVLSSTAVDWVALKFLTMRLALTLSLCRGWRFRISKS